MPVYEYTALDQKGKSRAGIIDAESSFAAREKLRSSGVFPVSINESEDTHTKKEPGTPFLSRPFARLKPSEITMITRQLATLVGAGFPLVPAIDSIITQIKPRLPKKLLSQIKDQIVAGNSFASALSLHPGTFSPIYINMVLAGETSGTLEIVLERLADIAEKQQALNSRIKAAMAYPILMSIIGTLVLLLLMTFIVPGITSIFTEMNQTLPPPTRLLIWTSDILKSSWWVIIIVLAGIGFALQRIKKTAWGRYHVDQFKLFLPVIGVLYKKLAAARFARTLGSLLENGVSMLSALEIVKNITGNVLVLNAIENAAIEVEKGYGLGAALSTSNTFPHLAIQMIQVGEQSGKLETMLNKTADVYENEVESSVMSMTSLLEPVMILIMGVLVGFIVLSICLPIFEMNQLVK